MPYLRPDRTGLPELTSEDGDNASEPAGMPRSESYLHLSELATSSVASHVAESSQHDQLKISRNALCHTSNVAAPIPLAAKEHSPKRNSTCAVDGVDDVKSPSRPSSIPVSFGSPLGSLQDLFIDYSTPRNDERDSLEPDDCSQRPNDPNSAVSPHLILTNEKGYKKETIMAFPKRLEEHDVTQSPLEEPSQKPQRPKTPEMMPKSSPKSHDLPAVTSEKSGQRSPSKSPKPSYYPPKQPRCSPKPDPSFPKLPSKLPRPVSLLPDETERPVELKRKSSTRQPPATQQSQAEGGVDFPAPPSTNASSKHRAEKEPLVVMPVTLSNQTSPITTPKSFEEEQKMDATYTGKSQIPAKWTSSGPSKRAEKTDDIIPSASWPQITMVKPSGPPPGLDIHSIIRQLTSSSCKDRHRRNVYWQPCPRISLCR